MARSKQLAGGRVPSTRSASRPRAAPWRQHLPALVVAGLTLAVFARMVGNGFTHWDDHKHLWENPYLVPPSWQGLAALWRAPYFGLYIPVTYTWLAAEAWLAQGSRAELAMGGLNPAVFHVGSLLLHVANAVWVYALLARLVSDRRAAAVGALLFALHPLQVESVAWVSETKGLLAGGLGLAAAWLWLASRPAETGSASPAAAQMARGRDWRWGLAAVVVFGLALLAKPSVVVLPAILLLLEWGWQRRPLRRALVELAPWFALALVAVIVTRGEQTAETIRNAVSWWQRPRIAGDALAFYLGKLVWPFPVAADYARRPLDVLSTPWSWLTATVPLGVWGALSIWPRRRELLVALGIFCVALLPNLGLIPFGFQDISTVADRYAYWAMLGPALALAWGLTQTTAWQAWRVAQGALVVCGVASWIAIGNWHDDQRLFAHCLAVSPRSYLAADKLGIVAMEANRLDEAAALFERSLAIEPLEASALVNLAATHQRQGKLEQAVAEFRRALELEPGNAPAHLNLGITRLALRQLPEALAEFRAAVELDPNLLPARQNLAAALAQSGDFAEGRQQIEFLLTRQPDNAEAHYLAGYLAYQLGDLQAAEQHLVESQRLRPDDPRIGPILQRLRAGGSGS